MLKLLARLAPIVLFLLPGAAHAETARTCRGYSGIDVLCISTKTEDLIQIPRTKWLLISNPLRIIDTSADTVSLLTAQNFRFDRSTYHTCPGAIEAKGSGNPGHFGSALALRPRRPGNYRLYMRGPNKRIEVFSLDARGQTPGLTWIGCIPEPKGLSLNSIAAVSGNGLVATNFATDTFGDFATPDGRAKMIRHLSSSSASGELWEWGPRAGWFKLPGTEGSGLNGIESSSDGRTLYVAEWGRNRIIEFPRRKVGSPRVIASLDFRPDNIRLQSDGKLAIGGHTGSVLAILNDCTFERRCEGIRSSAAILDPKNGEVRYVLKDLSMGPGENFVSGATLIGHRVWMASIGPDAAILRVGWDK